MKIDICNRIKLSHFFTKCQTMSNQHLNTLLHRIRMFCVRILIMPGNEVITLVNEKLTIRTTRAHVDRIGRLMSQMIWPWSITNNFRFGLNQNWHFDTKSIGDRWEGSFCWAFGPKKKRKRLTIASHDSFDLKVSTSYKISHLTYIHLTWKLPNNLPSTIRWIYLQIELIHLVMSQK